LYKQFIFKRASFLFKICKTRILTVLLFGCGTWSLTVREQHRFGATENRVLRRTFGHKREKGAGVSRRPHNEELHNLYASPNVIRVIKSRRMKWAGHIARVGKKYIQYFVWKS
jgi:hypothetical protein